MRVCDLYFHKFCVKWVLVPKYINEVILILIQYISIVDYCTAFSTFKCLNMLFHLIISKILKRISITYNFHANQKTIQT